MGAVEVVEVLVMNGVILAWLLHAFGAVVSPEYAHFLYWGTPVPIVVILIRRLVLYHKALAKVDKQVDALRPPTASISSDPTIPPHLERRSRRSAAGKGRRDRA